MHLSSYVERINIKRSSFSYQIDEFLRKVPDHVLPKLRCVPADNANTLSLGMVIWDDPDEKYVCYPTVRLSTIKRYGKFDHDYHKLLYNGDKSKVYEDILNRCIAHRK